MREHRKKERVEMENCFRGTLNQPKPIITATSTLWLWSAMAVR